MTHDEIKQLHQRLLAIAKDKHPDHSVTGLLSITDGVLRVLMTKKHISDEAIEATFNDIFKPDPEPKKRNK